MPTLNINNDQVNFPLANVGIGTTTTTSTFLNIANTGPQNEIVFRGTAYTNIFSETTNGIQFGISSTGNTAAIEFFTNNTEKVRITSGGNVLIGTATDSGFKLDVRSITTDPVAFFGFSQTASASNGLIKLNSGRIPQGGSDFSGESGIIFGHSGGTGGVNFDGQGGYIKSIRLNTYAASAQSDSALVFATSNDNVDAETMRITNGGNLLLGLTTDFGYLLSVNGTSYVQGAALFGNTVTALGNYLIDNATSSKKGYTFRSPASDWGAQTSGLYFNPINAVSGTPTFTVNLWNGTFGTAGYGGFTDVLTINGAGGAATFSGSITALSTLRLVGNMTVGSDTTQWVLGGVANGGAIFQKTHSGAGGFDDRYLRLGNIDNNGTPNYVLTVFNSNVGIGTTNPSTQLHISGTTTNITITDTSYGRTSNVGYIDSANLYFANDANSNTYIGRYNGVFLAYGGGNVLIGTTTDAGYKLSVAGNVVLGYAQNRPVFYDSNGGNFQIKANAGGWATGYLFQGSSGTSRGGWGGFGSADALSYLWAGDAYDTPTMVVQGGQGNVGIGTTNPTKKLHVASGGNEGIFMEGTANGGHWFDFKSANSNLWSMGAQPGLMGWYNRTDNSYKMVITDGGNIIIGSTTDGGFKLDVHGEILGRDDVRILNTYALVLNGTDDNWRIGRNTITDSGWLTGNTTQIVVSNASSGQGFQVVNSGGTALFEVEGISGYTRISISLGVGVNPSGTTGRIDASNDIVAYSSSDKRLKENITPIPFALDKVKALTGVMFDWKEETKEAHGHSGRDTGIIAQEVQAVMPTAVRTNDTGYLAVRYEKLIGLLIEANKELADQVANQQVQIDELKKLIK